MASRKTAIKNHPYKGIDPKKSVGGGGGSSRGRKQRRGEDVIRPIKVSLDDLYNGTTKKLSLSRNVLCSKCKGNGSKPGASMECKGCKGFGSMLSKRQLTPSFSQEVLEPCNVCKGTGKSDKDCCTQCKGDKVTQEKKVFEVFVEKGMQNGQKITFPGAANEAPGTVPGDMVFYLQLKKHPKFKRKGDDLFYEHTLSSTEASCGFQFALTHLDNRQLLVKSDPGEVISPDKDQFKGINDEGMPMYQRPFMKGKLYIHFTVDFPNCAQKRKMVAQEHELYQEDIPLKAPKLMTPRGGYFYKVIKLGLPVYIPFQFASGYALFRAHGFDDEVGWNFESTEEYIKLYNEVFTLVAFHPFESASDALFQMNAVSRNIVTEQMRSLLVKNLGEPYPKDHKYYIAEFFTNISIVTKMPSVVNHKTSNVIRGLRMNICKLINGLQPAELEKAQRDLAINYSRQRLKQIRAAPTKCGHESVGAIYCQNVCDVCQYLNGLQAAELEKAQRDLALALNYRRKWLKQSHAAAISSSSSINDGVVVVPHRMEGVFVAMRKNGDVICTKNLVPGEVVCGEELISNKDENGVEIEYRVWDPLKSNLVAAILSGVNNIWVKPGSRVLCIGDLCGATLSHLSDIVDHNGLVYALTKSIVALNMAEKRSNVIPIYGGLLDVRECCMLLSMVDVICADAFHPEVAFCPSLDKVHWIHLCCKHYLKTGGHYLVTTQENGVVSSSQGELMLRFPGYERREHKILELVKLKQIEEEVNFMAVGEFRTQLNGPVESSSPPCPIIRNI